MSYIIVGLGNPGEKYDETRHNAGRMMVHYFVAGANFPTFAFNEKYTSFVSESKVGKEKTQALLPETFMNKSGLAVGAAVKSVKVAKCLIVVHDDLDIPFGSFKISFGKSSGGHRGVESIIKSIKTKEFVRVRVGISPKTPSGKLKKPSGGEDVEKHILGKFKPAELAEFKKLSKKVGEALTVILEEGVAIAMGRFN